MKQIRLIPIGMVCAVVACLFVSCASDDVGVVEKSDKALVLNGGILSVKPIEMKTRGISFTTAPMNPDSIIEGEYTITAEDATRTPVNDNNWAGIDGNRDIAVQIGDGTAPYKYSVDAAGKLTSANPYYITTANNFTVKSWYPYTSTALSASGFTVQSNQSSIANLQKSDLLFSTNTAVNVSNSANNMTYTHATARLIVKVVSTKANYMLNQGIPTSITFTGAKLSSSVSTSGVLTATGSASEVSMYKLNSSVSNNVATTYYVACIPPQSAKLSLNIFINNMKYTAAMSSNGTFVAGKGNELTVNINSAKVYISSGNTIEVGDYYCSTPSGQAWIIKVDDLLTARATHSATPVAVVFSTSTSTTDQEHGWRLGYAMALKDANDGATCAWSTDNTKMVMSKQFPYKNERDLTYFEDLDGYTYSHVVIDNPNYNSTTYPAFFAAYNYQNTVPVSSLTSKWYLPSVGQWYYVCFKLGTANTRELYSWTGPNDISGVLTGEWCYARQAPQIATALNAKMSEVGEAYYTPFQVAPDCELGTGEHFWCSNESSSSNGVYSGFFNNLDMHIFGTNRDKTFTNNYVRAFLAF